MTQLGGGDLRGINIPIFKISIKQNRWYIKPLLTTKIPKTACCQISDYWSIMNKTMLFND